MNFAKPPFLALKNAATRCSRAIVSFEEDLQQPRRRAAMIVNESTTTCSQYSANRPSTTRSTRVAVK